MITGKELIELDIFHNIKLKAGRNGLDKEITWVYAKHTKTITPWVHGGELLLVSGYEHGITEDYLLELIEESISNNISAIVVEGGINFKKMPTAVITKAEKGNLPLFFVEGVISFLDLSRDVMDLIMENKYSTQKSVSIFDQLLSTTELTDKAIAQIFYGTGIPNNSLFMVGGFTLYYKNQISAGCKLEHFNQVNCISRKIKKYVDSVLEKRGIIQICKVNMDSVDFLLYGENEESLLQICSEFQMINDMINLEQNGFDVVVAFSDIMTDCKHILDGLDKTYFTANLLMNNAVSKSMNKFNELGSYQLLYYIENKSILIELRDKFLKQIYLQDKDSSSNMLATLKEYLKQDGNLLQTSKALFIHRNTLQYRLDKIEGIANVNLSDINVKRDFLNAFMILDVVPF